MPESSGSEHTTRTSTENLESCRLEIVVPHASDIDVCNVIQHRDSDRDEDSSSEIDALAGIAQRISLFYDEKVPVFIALQPDPLFIESESQFESFLSQINIFIEVVAVEGQSKGTEHSTRPNDGLHVLHGANLDEENSTRAVVEHNGSRLVLWKLVVPLGHPRVRLNSPKVLFAAVASIKASGSSKQLVSQEYLTNRNIFGVNLLEAYADDPSLGGPRPQLSALRVSRVSPAAQIPRESSGTISYRSRRMFHLFPAINVRLRHSQVGASTKPEVIASLDIEVTTEHAIINNVGLILTGGAADLIGGPLNELLPITCHPRDEVTFLYTLKQTDPTSYSISAPGPRPITLSLEATVLVSKDCHATIRSIWNTAIDLTNLLNPKIQPLTRMSRSMSIPVSYGGTIISSPGIKHDGPSQELSLQYTNPSISMDLTGLAITFSGPARVYVGEIFSWTVFVVNRSTRLRKLALAVPHKRWKADSGKALPPAAHDGTGHVLDESAVYTAHKSQILEPAELICLMNDVRIGPLAPSACHTTELQFIPLTTGVLHVEGIRVADIGINGTETTECRELPTIVSVRR